MVFETTIVPSIIGITTAYVAFGLFTFRTGEEFNSFIAYILVCVSSYFLTCKMIPIIQERNLKADLFGMDINKKGSNQLFIRHIFFYLGTPEG